MLVVTPCHNGDLEFLRQLLLWIQKLGSCKNHQLLIVADAGSAFDKVIAIRELGEQIFGEVRLITNEAAVVGWPDGCYSLFNTAAKYVAGQWPQPFLILEPDAIPLKAGWLDAIAEAYQKEGKPFMGCIYDSPGFGSNNRAMSGIACYPANTIELLPPAPMPVHWDMYGADVMTQNGAHTPLIKHFFGTMKLPPIFVESNAGAPINAFTLDWLPPECVLFHRDKTHSLIRLLTRKYFPAEALSTKIAVVFPVCGKDIQQALHHAKWLKSMRRMWRHRALIAYDYSVDVILLNEFMRLLDGCFERVEAFHYPLPPNPAYPAAANWCWQNCAYKMSEQPAPWLFMEADTVVLKNDWIDQLQREYDRACKPFMGPRVHQMGHYNGTMIYPANAALRMARAMACGEVHAFDMAAKDDIGDDGHDCGHLLFHTWTVMAGQFCPVGGGELPVNITPALAATIPRSAVAIHRIKDGSLVSALMSGSYVHG